MFSKVTDESQKLHDYLESEIKQNNTELELKDITSRYMLNVIGSIFFGIEVDCLKDSHHQFRKVSQLFIENRSIKSAIANVGIFMCPSLMKLCKIKFMHSGVEEYVSGLLKSIIDLRESETSERNDFIQLLLQLRKQKSGDKSEIEYLSFADCAAQIFVFYIGGTETSSSIISFCIYELAKSPRLMRQLQREIDAMLKATNGQATYESIKEMKLLEKCVMETMRKYPALPLLNRICTKAFPIPNSDHVIEVGTPIMISLVGTHRDPDHYTDPERFDPERFNNGDLKKDVYLPFGEGPHNCIAYRLGLVMIKTGLVALLSKYDFEALDDEILYDKVSIFLSDKNNIRVRISNRVN